MATWDQFEAHMGKVLPPKVVVKIDKAECELLIEALANRASRLESFGRFHPRSAGKNDRKAEAMRKLRAMLISEMKAPMPGVNTQGAPNES